MVLTGSLHLSHGLGLHKNHKFTETYKCEVGKSRSNLLDSTLSSRVSFQRRHSWNFSVSNNSNKSLHTLLYRHNAFKCHSILPTNVPSKLPILKTAAVGLKRCINILQGSPLLPKLAVAAGFTVFAAWGVLPLIRLIRNLIIHKNDSSWKKSSTYYILASYIQPMLLWTGAMLICRALDPVVLPTEASRVVKLRLLTFVRSLSTVLAFAYCLSSVVQQTQKFFMETNDTSNTRNMGFQFAGKAIYSAVWIAAFSLFMELLGFSTQKWVTAGGLGTVLLTLAGREIFTNFLSSAMIHATRPFVVNEWIQTKIEGYEVSGTVEHVGWWSPTIIRGEDREAVHIPNHKFTVSVVRNLTQKTHWRIKTHLAISHLDVIKINHIVADMRKVLAKNPQVEQQRLHRRVFLENINPENQALMILISCFVKTSHFEEYLCVKEAILLDLLRVISHHRARLATPIRTVQKIYSDADLENIPFADSSYSPNGVANRPLLLIEPAYKINGEDKTKNRTVRPNNAEKEGKTPSKESPKTGDPKVAEKVTSKPNPNTDSKVLEESNPESEKTTLNGKQTKSPSLGNHKSSSSSETKPPISKPVIEENIVLGVALEGSKRTLPIEDDDMASSSSTSSHGEVTELVGRLNGQGTSNPKADKDKKDGQVSSSPSSTSVDP